MNPNVKYEKLPAAPVPTAYIAPSESDFAAKSGNSSVQALGHALAAGEVQIGQAVEAAPKYRDVAFILLFWINLLAWIGVAAWSAVRPDAEERIFDDSNLNVFIGPLVIVVLVAVIAAAFFNALAFRFPVAYTYAALFLLGAYIIATIVLVCVYVEGATAVTAIFGVLTLLILIWTAFQLRRYKAFMAQLVAACRDVAALQRGMYGAAAATILLQMLWASAWVVASITLLRAWGGAEAYAVQVHSIFTFYWVSELIRNLVHVTIAGSMGSWYFASASHAPQNPTVSAFRRAATYSFGSIALGSLIIAILQTLRRIFRMLQASNSRNFWVLLLSILARIFLYLIEALLRFFNRYCLVICALFGTSYWQSMKKTVELFADNGYEMVMQNNVTAVIISVSAMLGAFSAGGAGALVAYLFGLPYAAMAAFGAVIGLFVVEGSFVVLESGSMTMMVCFLLHPEALRAKPERAALFASLSEAQAVFRRPKNAINA